MTKAKIGVGLAVLLCAIGGSPALAQDAKPKMGRLADGRAYRIDKDGLQLIDHIADLEVTVDELQRQVHALEDETIVQQRTIDDLTSGKGAPKRQIQEASVARSNIPPAVTPVAAPAPKCDTLVLPLQNRIADLQAQLDRPQVIPACNCDAATAPLREQVAQLQAALMSGPSKEEVAQQVQVARGLKQGLSERDEKLAALSEELANTRNNLDHATGQLQKKLARENELKEQVNVLSDQVEQLASAQPAVVSKEESAAPAAESRASLRTAAPEESEEIQELDATSLQSVRKDFNQQLSRIQSLIMKRKDLFDSLKSKGRGVSIQIQPLVTNSGVSLDSLRLNVSKLQPTSDVKGIQSGLAELEQKLQDDIGVLGRLTRG